MIIVTGGTVISQEVPLWSDDFEDGDSDGWVFYDDAVGTSNWHVEQGYLIQTSNIGENSLGTHAVSGLTTWDNYYISVNLVSTDDDYVGVLFRYQNAENYYRVRVGSQAGLSILAMSFSMVYDQTGIQSFLIPWLTSLKRYQYM
ncbi:MAG: hypothetical protein HOD37_15930 [Bacteroidetes bacterium]|jgi:hypothetical protein|nr:hypothetical protein [Bacteroidota bacterium]